MHVPYLNEKQIREVFEIYFGKLNSFGNIFKKWRIPTTFNVIFLFSGAPHLWTMMYFLVAIISVLNNQVSQVDTIERSIADEHPLMRHYRSYFVAISCILGLSGGVFFTSKVIVNTKKGKWENVCDAGGIRDNL